MKHALRALALLLCVLLLSGCTWPEVVPWAREEEAEEESGDRMSYSDMAILLSGYMCVMDSYRYGEIWYKG